MRLLDSLACKPITSRPIGTLWAGFPRGIVDAFFVWTANESVGRDHRLHGMLFQESQHLLTDCRVTAHINVLREVLREPSFEWVRFATFVAHDSHNNLGRDVGCWAIKRNHRGRVTAKPLLSFLVYPGSAFSSVRPSFELHGLV